MAKIERFKKGTLLTINKTSSAKYAIPIAVLAGMYAPGCGSPTPRVTEQTQKPPVSQSLEQKAAETPNTPRRFSDQELIKLYNKYTPKAAEFYKKMDDAVVEFAIRSGISVDQVSDDDNKRIRSPYWDEMNSDSDIKAVASLDRQTQQHLGKLVSKQVDMSRAKRGQGEFYVKGSREVDVYYDPEQNLLIGKPDVEVNLFRVTNPLVFTNSRGREVVEIPPGYWASFGDFGPKPGDYAKPFIQSEVADIRHNLDLLEDLLKKIKPNTSPEELQKLLADGLGSGEGDKTRGKFYDYVLNPGEEVPDITPTHLQAGAARMRQQIWRLELLLR